MKITESRLRQIIREDLAGFLNKTKDIQYSSDSIDPTFDKLPNEEFKPAARAVKQAWAAEADHDFMHDVIKVHWLKFIGTEAQLQRLSNMSGKNEVSTMGYLPESEEFKSKWGPIGIVVQGRTTLAANSMSAIAWNAPGMSKPSTTPAAMPRPTHTVKNRSNNPTLRSSLVF